MSTAPVDDLGEEREIDLRSLREKLLARWWIVLGGLILGAVVGILIGTGGGKVFDAKALIYLGQPFTTEGGAQVNSIATNPRTVAALVRNEATLTQVSEESGVPVANLRGAVSAVAITAVGTSAGLGRSAPLMEITVQLKDKANAEAAANAFAKAVVDEVGGYVDNKIKLLEQRIAADNADLEAAQKRIAAAIQQLDQLARNGSAIGLSDRLLLQANANSTLQFYEARSTNRRFDLNDAEQLLSLAQNVERSRVVQEAVGAPTTARSRRNSLVVGALIGLILGGLAGAALPDRRRRKTPAPA